MTRVRHAALLLAAGESRRLGTPKQLLSFGGEPLVQRAARALLATQPSALYVVVGARADEVFTVVAGLGALRIDCEDWACGLSASLRAGIAALPGNVEAALIALCDQPAMNAGHLNALLDAFRSRPERAVASAYAGVLGVPAVLPRAWFEDVAKLSGDSGARELLRSPGRPVLAVAGPALAYDIDEPADRSSL